MPQGTGTVSKVFDRKWQDKVLYSFKLDGDDQYYRTGENKPACNEGDSISFSYGQTAGGANNVQRGSLTVGTSAAPKPNGSGGQQRSAARGPDPRQHMIMYQSATNYAIQMTTAALAAGILPAAGTNKAAKWDTYKGLVCEIRDEVFSDFIAAEERLNKGEPILAKPEVEEKEPDDNDWT